MSDIPADVLDSLSKFLNSLENLENVLEEVTLSAYSDNIKLSPVEKIRIDLSLLLTLNSLYWSYLASLGKNPKEDEELMGELKRNKEYMARLQALEERENRPKINPRGAKAFVRNALFDHNV